MILFCVKLHMYIFVSCLTDSLYPCSHHSLRKVKNFIVGKLLLADYGKYRFFANNVLYIFHCTV